MTGSIEEKNQELRLNFCQNCFNIHYAYKISDELVTPFSLPVSLNINASFGYLGSSSTINVPTYLEVSKDVFYCSQFMSSLQLESVTQIVPEPQKLPQALIEKCAAISVRPDAIKSLTDAMQCKLSLFLPFIF